MRSAQEIRGDFLLDPDVAYLDHGAFGATPQPVLERQLELRAELERGPVGFLARRLPAALDNVREVVAQYVGVRDPGRLVFLPNATTALNAVAASLPLRPDDEVVVTELEYGAMRLLWDEIGRRTGARIVTAEVALPVREVTELADAVWSRITSRTRALFFSHVTSETALVFPVKELCARARAAGVLTVVDGAHGPGQIDLALDALGVDCYAGNGHKWLCAPKGSAFLFAREDVHEWLVPPVVSWGWAENGAATFQDRFSWSGTADPTAVLALPTAITYQSDNDWPQLRHRCRELAERTQTDVLSRLGGEALAPVAIQAPQMVAFPVPVDDAEWLGEHLRRDHSIEISVHRVDDRTLVRLSVQAYTTEEECARLVEALETAVREKGSS